MKEYFVHDGQSGKGPYTIEQLSSFFLKKDTPWFEGLEQWTVAENIEELKELFSSKPVLPPLAKTINESLVGSYVPKLKGASQKLSILLFLRYGNLYS